MPGGFLRRHLNRLQLRLFWANFCYIQFLQPSHSIGYIQSHNFTSFERIFFLKKFIVVDVKRLFIISSITINMHGICWYFNFVGLFHVCCGCGHVWKAIPWFFLKFQRVLPEEFYSQLSHPARYETFAVVDFEGVLTLIWYCPIR